MRFLILVFVGLICGCSKVDRPSLSYNGSGPLTLSREVQVLLLRYKSEKYPGTLAVSIDGGHGGYNYCPEDKCSEEDSIMPALSYCETISNGTPCRVYAHKGKIVWNYNEKYHGLFERTFDRVFTLNWEGYENPMKGTVENMDKFKLGYMRVMLPENRGKCRGLFDMDSEKGGYWNISCNNGNAASGRLTPDKNKVFGTGVDQKGQSVSLVIENVEKPVSDTEKTKEVKEK